MGMRIASPEKEVILPVVNAAKNKTLDIGTYQEFYSS